MHYNFVYNDYKVMWNSQLYIVQAAIPISPIHLSFFWMLFGSGGFRSDIFMGHDGGVHLRKNSKEEA